MLLSKEKHRGRNANKHCKNTYSQTEIPNWKQEVDNTNSVNGLYMNNIWKDNLKTKWGSQATQLQYSEKQLLILSDDIFSN